MSEHTLLGAHPAAPALHEAPEPGRRFLFSPWHLVLLPAALLMVLPLVWMVVTSLETTKETQHYPPVLVPQHVQAGNYSWVLQQAPFDEQV